MRSTIICVDDEKLLLNMLYQQLQKWFGKKYSVKKAANATEALQILDECIALGEDVSVFISDYIMPITKGDELLTMVKERDPRIKRIMLTGYSAIDGIVNAINKAGIYRYISKPWDNKDLMLTLLEAIKAYEQDKITAKLSKNYETLYYKYQTLYDESYVNYNEILKVLSLVCDIRANEEDNRSERISKYCNLMGTALDFDEKKLKVVTNCGLLCDIGKIAMSDEELKTLEESKPLSPICIKLQMQQTRFSDRILMNAISSDEFIDNIKYQFETFDGKGPYAMKGEDIPIGARILYIARLYDKIASSLTGAPIDSIISKFVAQGNTYIDMRITSLFVKQLKKIKRE